MIEHITYESANAELSCLNLSSHLIITATSGDAYSVTSQLSSGLSYHCSPCFLSSRTGLCAVLQTQEAALCLRAFALPFPSANYPHSLFCCSLQVLFHMSLSAVLPWHFFLKQHSPLSITPHLDLLFLLPPDVLKRYFQFICWLPQQYKHWHLLDSFTPVPKTVPGTL